MIEVGARSLAIGALAALVGCIGVQSSNVKLAAGTPARTIETAASPELPSHLADAPKASGLQPTLPSSTFASILASAFGSAPPMKILLVGDSTANCLGWGLRTFQSPELVVELRAKDGCELLTDTCGAETWAAMTKELEPHESLLFVGGAFLYGVTSDGRWQKSCEAAWDARFESHLTQHLGELTAPGSRVWAVTVPYPLGVYDTADYRREVDCINASIRKSAARVDGVKILDLAERLCPKGVCPRAHDGLELRPDGVHYAIDALEPISRWILGELRR